MRHSIILSFLLVILTLLFIFPLFNTGYTNNMGSLEPATLVMARRVAEHGIWGWEPRWYLGFPFRFAGPPASWWVLGAIEKLGFFDLLAVYRVLKALALVAFPITFYFLARRVFGVYEEIASLAASKKRSADLKSTSISSTPPRSGFRQHQILIDLSLRFLGWLHHVFTWRQSYRSQLSAFLSSVFLIVLPSVGYLFPKFFPIGRQFGFAPSWLQQEFSRSLGLVLLPLVLIFYWRLLEKISFRRLLVAILATAILFLTDGVTALALLVGVAVILIIENFRAGPVSRFPPASARSNQKSNGDQGDNVELRAVGNPPTTATRNSNVSSQGHPARKVTAVGLALALAFLLDAFFFTPQNIRLIASSPSISGIGLVSFIKVMVQAAIGLGPAVLVIISMKLLTKGRQPLAFIWLWLLPFAAITLLFYFSNREFLTEYTRFLPEIEIGIALILGYFVPKTILNFKFKILNLNILAILFVTLLYSLYLLPQRWRLFSTHPDMTKTVEYQVAKWLDQEMENGISPRVFLSGSTAFWLNEFAPSTWQVRGGIDQASTNPFWARAVYQIRTSPDVETGLLWLKALRVGYLVIHDQSSSEYYHDFIYPQKFEGVCLGPAGPVTSFLPASAQSYQPSQPSRSSKSEALRAVGNPSTGATRSECELVFTSGKGDRIYRVDSSMASVVSQAGLKSLLLPDPAKKNEWQALDVYVDWLQEGKSAKLEETGDKLLVKADIGKDEVLALGVTYDRGWQVKDPQGAKLKSARDPLGNLVVFPNKEGEQTISLEFKEGLDLWFGIVVSCATLLFIRFILPKKLPVILKKAEKGWEEEE